MHVCIYIYIYIYRYNRASRSQRGSVGRLRRVALISAGGISSRKQKVLARGRVNHRKRISRGTGCRQHLNAKGADGTLCSSSCCSSNTLETMRIEMWSQLRGIYI